MNTPSELVRTPRRAAVAAWVGSALEYYDLAIYGTAAALVFPKIFFPEGNDSAATIAAFATFGVAYVARPIGSFLMGHIGDRLGRKTIMVGTLLLMGVSTFLVGCLPTYAPGRAARADPAGDPAPAPGTLRRRRAGRRELDVLRARPRRTSAASSPASPSAAPRAARCSHRPSSCRSPRCCPRTSCWPGAGGSRSCSARSWCSSACYIRLKLEETPEFRAEEEQDEVAEGAARACSSATTGRTCCASSSPPSSRWSTRCSRSSR